MIEWAEARQPLASWAGISDPPLPPAGVLEPVDTCTWIPTKDNRLLLISSATGGWVFCDPAGRSDVEHRWGQTCNPRHDPLVEILWRRGLATVGGLGAFDHVDVGSAIEASRQRYTIVLLMSTGCNLACSYCYLGHRQPTPDVSMPLETAFAAVDAALAQPWDEVMFDFGEIAVSGGRFETVARHARLRAAEMGKRMQLAVQTNATTIDATTADVLADFNAVVGISLDGPQALHDAGRTFRSGAGSYTRVLRALRLLEERSVPVHLIATISRHNIDHPIEVVEELASHDPTSFLLKPVLAEGEARTAWENEGVRPDAYADFMVTVLRHAALHGPRYLDQTATKFMLRLLGDHNGWRDSCTSRSCGSGRSLHVVDPSGRTHSCPRFVEEAADAGPVSVTLGRWRPSPPLPTAPVLTDLLPPTLRTPPADCNGCPWLSTCGGGCTLISHDPSQPAIPQPDPHCVAYDDLHRELVSTLLPMYLDGNFAEAPIFNGAKSLRLEESYP